MATSYLPEAFTCAPSFRMESVLAICARAFGLLFFR